MRLVIIDVTSWTGIHTDKEQIQFSDEDAHEDNETALAKDGKWSQRVGEESLRRNIHHVSEDSGISF